MTLFFIDKNRENNKFKLTNILNKIEEKTAENKVFLTLPINEKTKNKKIKRVMKKLDKYNIKTAILSDDLYNMEELKNELYSRNINILDGKYLFKLLTKDVIEYICKKANKPIEKTEVSILTNDVSIINKEIIIELAEKVKTLNIITNHVDDFGELEDYLYNEKGIIIKVSNNYKTALHKTNIIINMDFAQEMIDKYSIPNKCVMANINGRIKIKSKKFNGININSYNIIELDKYKIEGYSNKFIYESSILSKEYKVAKKQILEDKIKIQNLVGENGDINIQEFIIL